MEHRQSDKSSDNYRKSIVCIQYNELFQQNQSMLNEYIEFCSERHVLPIFKFNIKQLHLYGTIKSTKEAECFINKYGNNDDAAIHYLFHGCPESASNQIIERGFNRNYCGINGCCYGRGVYFSKHADYSNRYAKTNGNNEKRMFYSRVLIGRSMIGNSKINQPNDGFDTTTDGNHIFVCYHDSQCYPEYLLTYV
ncbi:unnamed protein product [Rotaria magnacalcarata]|uniref:Poly [ADP-ribose] polymerase n=1 Tax=Rotaria magnacalcarata TaxID=392030 RepID=A0A8S2LUJ0_9BILA|nr:unnamed protein product [Rotaria magnacalcarata]